MLPQSAMVRITWPRPVGFGYLKEILLVRIAYLDPFSGASGDMMLGALVDAGLPLSTLQHELRKLDLSGYELRAEVTSQHGIGGTRVTVDAHDDETHRHWSDIREMIVSSRLDSRVRDAALGIFERLAEAEAAIHQAPVEHVHFHEVGGIDAIVDICGACIGLAALGVERVFSGPPRLGTGTVRAAHGILPIPAPATARLLAESKAPTLGPLAGHESVEAELLTPTGAAIISTLAEFRRPDFTLTAIGYGFGTKELPWTNALRLFIGEMDDAQSFATGGEYLLETNLDDMNPQFYDLLTERLFATGALDVWLTPVQMKKGRPATVVSVICAANQRAELEDVLIINSSTLGVRVTPIERTKAARRIEVVITRWGEVRVKPRGWNGRIIDATPEYDDCVKIAREHDLPIRLIWNEAHRLGEVFVGRRLSDLVGDPPRAISAPS